MYDTKGKPNPAMDFLNLTQFQIDTSPDIKIMICFVGGIDCTAKEDFISYLKYNLIYFVVFSLKLALLVKYWKFKPKLTLYGMCFELNLYNDADFLALGPMIRSKLKVKSILKINLSNFPIPSWPNQLDHFDLKQDSDK